MSLFAISNEKLKNFYEETKNIVVDVEKQNYGFSGCGNNACYGTCEWSPCTNLCAATSK